MILKAKERYTNKLRKRLYDPSMIPKSYWPILNSFLINKKQELFNLNFTSQCTPIKNSSELPPLCYKTNELLVSVNIREDDIYLTLTNLNLGKSLWMG